MKSITKVLILFMSFAIFTSVHAQTDAGKFLLGGSTDFTFASGTTKVKYDGGSENGPKSTAINFTPSFGYLVVNNFAIGLRIELEYEQQKYEGEKISSTLFVAAPFLRYYFTPGKIKPFAEVMGGFGSVNSQSDDGFTEDETMKITVIAGDVGVAFFLNDNVSLDLSAGYSYSTAKDKDIDDVKFISSQFTFNVGFTIVL